MVAAPKPAAAAAAAPVAVTPSTASAVVAGNGEIKGRSVSGRFWRSGNNKRCVSRVTGKEWEGCVRWERDIFLFIGIELSEKEWRTESKKGEERGKETKSQ